MAKPLPATHSNRGTAGSLIAPPPGKAVPNYDLANDGGHLDLGADPHAEESGDEFDVLRGENEQLRSLCVELEQALQEATQHSDQNFQDRVKEYEALLEEKSETIRELHEQMHAAQATIAELEATSKPQYTGPAPREDELLNLSEELERERRQLQEDEQALMEQMKDMEVTMARERAEMARQRNDLQRLQSEIRHELERLERNGALQSKIDGLKSKFQDATMRRGMASSAGVPQQTPQAQGQPVPPKKDNGGSLIGRLFGGK